MQLGPSMDDLHIDFVITPEEIPDLESPMSTEHLVSLNHLAALFKAVPWGSQLPAIDFKALGAPPSRIHTLVGDVAWNKCWEDRATNISVDHMVPFKILNIVQWVISSMTDCQLTSEVTAAGAQRYQEASNRAKKRKAEGSPY